MKLELEDLIANKAFEDLSAAEQAWVLTQMTAEDYQLQHIMVVQSQALWLEEEQGLEPQPPSTAIFAALQQKSTHAIAPPIPTVSKSVLVAIFSHRIKTWQAVAASVLLLLLWQIGGGTSASEESTLLAHPPTVDTVYQYITQVKEVLQPVDTVIKIVYKEIVVPAPQVEQGGALLADASDSLDLEAVVATNPSSFDDILQYRSVSAGQPASQDTFFQLLGRELQL